MIAMKEKRMQCWRSLRRIALGTGIGAALLMAGIPALESAAADPPLPEAGALPPRTQISTDAHRPASLCPASLCPTGHRSANICSASLRPTSLCPGSGFWHTQTQAWALSIPKIEIDPNCLEPTAVNEVYVTGSISCGSGQEIVLFAEDGKTELARVKAANSGSEARFRLKVPAAYAEGKAEGSERSGAFANQKRPADMNVFVQSRSDTGTAASKKVMVTISLDRLGTKAAATTGQTQTTGTAKPASASKPTSAAKPTSASKPASNKKPTSATKPTSASKPVKTVPSKKEKTTIAKEKRTQTISAPKRMVLTNLEPGKRLKASASSGGKLTYKSSNPRVAVVNSRGRIIKKGNGKAVITIRQAGSGSFRAANRQIQVVCRKSTRQEQIDAAVDWAIRIANDNRFTYGSGKGAHHFGCYFCGTNYGPRKHMKPSARYKRTYCCNPFVSAAYAHGAKHPRMLAACRRGEGIGMERWTFYRYGCWKCVGKPSYNKLQKGDVMVRRRHVAMYVGGHRQVHASGGNWSAGSIAVIHMSRARYRTFQFVMRYTGY